MRVPTRFLPATLACLLLAPAAATAQQGDVQIPKVYTNIAIANGQPVVNGPDGKVYPLKEGNPQWTTRQLRGNPEGAPDGFVFNFVDEDNDLRVEGGTVFFALINLSEQYPLPKFHYSTAIDQTGRAHVKMVGTLDGAKDITGWTQTGRGNLYYRVQSAVGEVLYEGMFSFRAASPTGPYTVEPSSIVEGPMVEKVAHDRATITFETLTDATASVSLEGGPSVDSPSGTMHEVDLTGLTPNTEYTYTVRTEGDALTFGFRTAPAPGSREPFTFAFGSDSRHGIDSGERHEVGVNLYMMRRVMPVATSRGAAFMQFTGDMVNGYNTYPSVQEVQYRNWRRAVTPFAARLPMFIGAGNHEVVVHQFDDGSRFGLEIPRFPFETESPAVIFANHFANFENGPASEDGSALDPDPSTTDFPSYTETVYDYTWGNIAMIVLNSDYLYSPYLSDSADPLVGGNIHGYLMDNQLAWLQQRLEAYQQDANIDHVFLSVHTPIFPNGGHVGDDMFYDGDNAHRPVIAGQPAAKGIIERRDELLRLIDANDKVKAVLAGDEHNYSRVQAGPGIPLYAENGFRPDNPVELTRTFHHMTNGATGAPYYALEAAPWHVGYELGGEGDYLKKFTTQFAVVLIHVEGDKLTLEVVDPENLELIERVEL